MSSILMRDLQDGYADKLEQDRVEEVKKRGSYLHYGYISAKEALKSKDIDYHSNGVAHVFCDKNVLYGMAELSAFKQTGWTYYSHYSGRFALSISNVIGDKSYIEVKLPG